MEAQFSNPLPHINVQKRKPSVMKGFKKFFLIVSGIIGMIISIFLFCTIILIPFALLMWVGSIGMFAFVGDKYQVTCPSCKKKMVVGKNQEDFKCKRCSQPTIINWIEYKK